MLVPRTTPPKYTLLSLLIPFVVVSFHFETLRLTPFEQHTWKVPVLHYTIVPHEPFEVTVLTMMPAVLLE